MAIQVIGNGGTVAEVGASFRELLVGPRPISYGALGHYRASVVTGTLAAALAAGAQLWQLKWTDATRLGALLRLRCRFLPLTPFTGATLSDHTSVDAFQARSFAGGGGGTTLTLSGNNQKARTSMGSSLATVNVATTAALTAATTLDAQPFAQSLRKGNRVNPASATEETIQPAQDGLNYEPNISDGEHPITFAQNEGVVVRNRTVWPAAGTGILLIEYVLAEVNTF